MTRGAAGRRLAWPGVAWGVRRSGADSARRVSGWREGAHELSNRKWELELFVLRSPQSESCCLRTEGLGSGRGPRPSSSHLIALSPPDGMTLRLRKLNAQGCWSLSNAAC